MVQVYFTSISKLSNFCRPSIKRTFYYNECQSRKYRKFTNFPDFYKLENSIFFVLSESDEDEDDDDE